MGLMLWLFPLCFLVIPHVQSSSKEWTINVPERIPVVEGHCVVIPCTVTFPWHAKKRVVPYKVRGYWKRGQTVISTNNRRPPRTSQEYKGRTQFLGDMRHRCCTMKLHRVSPRDTGPFYFRIEIPWFNRFSYINNAVTIDVLRDPLPPTLSVKGTAQRRVYCSAIFSCPSYIPQLSWNTQVWARTRARKRKSWQWEIYSTFTFTPKVGINTTFTCMVKYRNGKKAQSSIIITK
ncbi:sialic acid-binding Ig-like lectin 14 [Notolabrus celidotus]|uniref:sialic acid-binding Ig-like lectin 14 n=1 Tax=Notolabrus celidotus TaxID=1203425 RepID=UPI0014906012|nr:sialic acid-binding Ig-like lectin 14 [Notolabrus celidotus]